MQYRQDLRNLDRLVTWEGIIGRKKRKTFNRFLEHPDPRIRRYAEELVAEDVQARTRMGFLEDGDYSEPEEDDLGFSEAAVELSPSDSCSPNEINEFDDEDIPF